MGKSAATDRHSLPSLTHSFTLECKRDDFEIEQGIQGVSRVDISYTALLGVGLSNCGIEACSD